MKRVILLGLALAFALRTASPAHAAIIVVNRAHPRSDGAMAMLLPTPALPDAPRGGRECTIVGTAGEDRLRGTQHDDVICALAGTDRVTGRAGNDTLLLGRGWDRFWGGRATT